MTAYLNTFAVPAASAHAFAISTLVKALKADRTTPGAADGTWDALDEMWLAGANSQQTTRGLKRKANLTINGTLTHTPISAFAGMDRPDTLARALSRHPLLALNTRSTARCSAAWSMIHRPETEIFFGVYPHQRRASGLDRAAFDAPAGISMTATVLAASGQATTASSRPSS